MHFSDLMTSEFCACVVSVVPDSITRLLSGYLLLIENLKPIFIILVKALAGWQCLNGCLLICRAEENMYIQQQSSEGKSLLAA